MRRREPWNLRGLVLNRIVSVLFVALALVFIGCADTKEDRRAGAPLPVTVESQNFNVIQVAHPEQFVLATAIKYVSMSPLTVIGTIRPDLSGTEPGIWGATASVVLVNQRGGKPMTEPRWCPQFEQTALTRVWIICGLREDDLVGVHVGETVKIRMNANSENVFTGRVSKVSPNIDPTTGRAEVRIQARNPGFLSAGMFVTVTFSARKKETHTAVPATAILYFHDRAWVYVPEGDRGFRRVDVVAGQIFPGNRQEIILGIKPGDQVVQDASLLQKTVER